MDREDIRNRSGRKIGQLEFHRNGIIVARYMGRKVAEYKEAYDRTMFMDGGSERGDHTVRAIEEAYEEDAA